MKTKLFAKSFSIFLMFFLFQNLSAQWKMSYTVHFRYANSVAVMDYNHIILAGGNEFNDRKRSLYWTADTAQSWGVIFDDFNPWLKSVSNVGSSLGMIACGYEGSIIKSPDGGVTWNWLIPPSSVSNRHFNSVFFVDSLVGYIAGGFPVSDSSTQTIIKTTNGGVTWSVLRDTAAYWLKSIYFSDAAHGIAVGSRGTILRTTNGGLNWTHVTPGDTTIASRELNGVYMLDNNVGFIVGGNKSGNPMQTILKTTNGGVTWVLLQDQLGPMLNSIDFSSAGKAYIVGDLGTVLHSVDTGNTWVNLNLPDSLTESHTLDFLDVDFKNDSFGVIAGRAMALRYYIPTLPGRPVEPTDTTLSVITKVATNISETGVRLRGMVNSNGTPLRLRFQYGTTLNLGMYTPANIYSLSDSLATPVFADLSGLSPNTLYYYRLEANGGGNVYVGETRTFYTTDCMIPNCDFENWGGRQLQNFPSDWYRSGMTERVTDRVSGNYAVHLKNQIDSLPNPAVLGVFSNGSSGAAFPVFDRYEEFNGYFKFFPQNADSLFVVVSMYKNGSLIGGNTLIIDSTVAQWQPFSFMINYYDSTSVPDSAQVSFSLGSNIARGESEVYIDNINFDGFRQDSSILGVNTLSQDILCSIYPNPAQAVLNIEYVAVGKGESSVVITDIQGRNLFSETLHSGIGTVKYQFVTENLANGVYVVRINNDFFDIKRKFIVEH